MICDEPGCPQDALVGLNERNLCIEHFESNLAAIRDRLAKARWAALSPVGWDP